MNNYVAIRHAVDARHIEIKSLNTSWSHCINKFWHLGESVRLL